MGTREPPHEEPLGEYRRKRDPARTPEPVPPQPLDPLPQGNDDTFVIQEHHARALHWDFRLERDGVLVSWAVPKGLPAHPKRNHLAVHAEDHPLEYASFEGEIPAGQYGGGRVALWDHGRYETLKWNEREVMVVLHGRRVSGRYVLFATGRGDRDWMVHRMDPPERPGWTPIPTGLAPMEATRGRLPRDPSDWGFELDWGGDRALASIDGGRLALTGFTDASAATGVELTGGFPELRDLGVSFGATPALLDGELVCLGVDGRPNRARLQRRLEAARPGASGSAARRLASSLPVTYLVADLLYLDGSSLLEQPYATRRELLERLELSGATWRAVPSFRGGGRAVLAAAAENGMPAVLAKRLDSPYRPGQQSRDWRRVPVSRG